MAKKKAKHSSGQQFLSPEQYMKQRIRTLPIGQCYYSMSIFGSGIGFVIVSRLHTGGRISYAVYIVDTFCLGVKASNYELRQDPEELEELMNNIDSELRVKKCSYAEAHNIVWGAVAFAEEGGIEPDKSFALTQYMLEEDTDDIPQIDYPFGKDGQHFLCAADRRDADRYLPKLQAALGDNFKYVIGVEDSDDYDWADEDEPYPDQQSEPASVPPLKPVPRPMLIYPWLMDELCKPENAYCLNDSLIDRLLALPHEELREDLETIIRFSIACTKDKEIHDIYYIDIRYGGMVANAMTLLTEVGNDTSSLELLLEVLRQPDEYYYHHFSDAAIEILIPALYKLGHNKLDTLYSYMEEDEVFFLCKALVAYAVMRIVWFEPERKPDVVEWYKKVLRLAAEKLPEYECIHGITAGMIACTAVDVKSIELIPYLKEMYDTGRVAEDVFGSYDDVKEDILDYHRTELKVKCILDVHERFRCIKEKMESQEQQ